MSTKSTLWNLDEHTKGKHAVLRSYLNAWFPILSRYNGRILFIDGFAGPGQYSSGEDGSPLIALRAIKDHIAEQAFQEIVCFFIEKDKSRASHLASLIEEMKISKQVPEKCKVYIQNGSFNETMRDLLQYLESSQSNMIPAFVMLDPFGVSDPPMSVIQKLFKNNKIEVYISFMYEYINRFKSGPEFESHLDSLFGTSGWRHGLTIKDSAERKHFYFNLYEAQLIKAGATHVMRFELFAGNRHKYAIFFGTKSLLGADKMKQAIWKIVPSGDYKFHGGRSEQLEFSVSDINFEPLRQAIQGFLETKPRLAWVPIEELQEFVIAKTDYHSGQFKRNILKPLEQAEKIEVDPKSRKVKLTYPDGSLLRWKH